MKIVIATRNPGKLREMRALFTTDDAVEIIPLDGFGDIPDAIEDGASFEQNALKKARHVASLTGLPALADDSGLVIDALGGEPGIRSARYGPAGADDHERNNLVLERMGNVPDGERTARFVCVIAISLPGGKDYFAYGECAGEIARQARGEGGFGYDPIFFLPGRGKTMAEIPSEEKNRISHRSKALAKARDIIRRLA